MVVKCWDVENQDFGDDAVTGANDQGRWPWNGKLKWYVGHDCDEET